MPLLQQWSTQPGGRAAIWKIEEEESFFLKNLAALGFQPLASALPRHPVRRLERLAGRFLLAQLQPGFPLADICPDAFDKPRVPQNQPFFSISHSYPFVSVILSEYSECGIDIQCWHPRMDRLKDKFLSQEEQALLQHDLKGYTLGWCMKEAAYKWNGRRGIDFIVGLHIQHVQFNQPLQGIIQITQEKGLQELSIAGQIHNEFAIAWSLI